MTITVMITTRNRQDDLRRTLTALAGMQPPPDEIIVTADGCSDGTVPMIESDFPAIRLSVNASGQGSIPSRDRMLRQARGDIVLSLDDDSYPMDSDFFARLPEIFARHPEAAVIVFPELRGGEGSAVLDPPASEPGRYLPAYPNCAAAMRKEFYLRTAGYPTFFSHAYEEPDYALQCYGHGGAVWLETSLVIRHHFSNVNRSRLRVHQLNARNELWSVWLRCPWPWLPLVSLFRVWSQALAAAREGAGVLAKEPLWWWQALHGLTKCSRQRQPLPWPVYLGWMRLSRKMVRSPEHLRAHFGQS